MSTRRAILFVLVPLLAAPTFACGPKIDDPADVAAIKEISANWSKAVNAGDPDAVLANFEDDAFLMWPNQSILSGKDAIRAAMQANVERYTSAETVTSEDVRVSGDLGFARGVYSGKSVPKAVGEAAVEEKGKWLAVFARQADGSWRIRCTISNSDVPVAQTLWPSSEDEVAVLQAERDWTNAWRTMDVGAMDRVLAAEFLESFGGQVNTKAKVLANMRAGIYKVESAEASDMRVLVFGDHAVVNGTTTVKQTLRGKDDSGTARWTDTFVKRDGRWQAVMGYAVKAQ
jgi:uncharacterized protein (TIGR02246 family)